MKKRTILIVFVIFLFLLADSQSQISWTPLQTGFSDNLTSVHFYDNSYGMAVSSSGKIIKTTNGGINWSQVISGLPINFSDVRIVNSTNACAAGKNTSLGYLIIIRTTNTGLTWDSVYSYTNSNYSFSFNNMKFFGDTGVVCMNYSLYGTAIKSFNRGLNWSWVQGPSMFSYQDFAFVTPLNYYVFSYIEIFVPNPPYPHYEYKQYSLRTTDGGSGWYQVQYDNVLTNYGVRGYFYNANIGYMFKSNGGFMYTITSGQNWYSGSAPALSTITSAFPLTDNILFVTGMNSATTPLIAKTTNRGNSWALTMLYGVTAVNKINFINQLTGWAACNNGLIYKTTDGGLTNFSGNESSIPDEYRLFQNNPNPFNPSTNIKFSIPEACSVKISVYDVTGKELEIITNNRLTTGEYITTWDGSSRPSGIYFYRITAGKFSETKKMMLVK